MFLTFHAIVTNTGTVVKHIHIQLPQTYIQWNKPNHVTAAWLIRLPFRRSTTHYILITAGNICHYFITETFCRADHRLHMYSWYSTNVSPAMHLCLHNIAVTAKSGLPHGQIISTIWLATCNIVKYLRNSKIRQSNKDACIAVSHNDLNHVKTTTSLSKPHNTWPALTKHYCHL